MKKRTEQTIAIAAPPEEVLDVITDYESYPEFLDEITGATVLAREGNSAVVRFELKLLMRLEYTLRLTAESPTGVRWELDESPVMRANSGFWRLEAVDGGNATQATYSLDVELVGRLPTSVSDRLLGLTLPAVLESFKTRIESRPIA